MKLLAFMPEGNHRDILKHIMKYGIELKILLEEISLLEQFMMINKYQLKKSYRYGIETDFHNDELRSEKLNV